MQIAKRKKLVGLTFAAPFLIGFIAFYIAPFAVSIAMSFTKRWQFVGLENYLSVIQGRAFQLASYNTIRFILIGVPLIIVISLAASLLLNGKFLGSSIFRSIFLLPLVTPIAATVMVFQVAFAESGLMSGLFRFLNIPVESWLNSDKAFTVLLVLYIWKNFGYNIVLFLSAFNTIPEEFYEVATLEGASGFDKLRYITMPLLAPIFSFVCIISVINSFKSFREAFILGGTMPHKSIYMLQHFMNNNFQNLNYQRLSTAAFMIFSVIGILVLVILPLRKKAGELR